MKLPAKKIEKKTLIIVTALVLTLCVVIGAFVLPRLLKGGAETVSYETALPGTGLWVIKDDLFTGGTEEKPLQENDLKDEVKALMTYVGENRIAEIYWELSLSEDYENTLGFLSTLAEKAGVKVYAVLPAPEEATLAAGAGSLVETMKTVRKTAAVDGFILDASGVLPEQTAELLSAVRALAAADDGTLGLVYQGLGSLDGTGALSLSDLSTLVKEKSVSLLLPRLSGTVDEGYTALVESWNSLSGAAIRPYAPAGFNEKEVSYQLFYNSTEGQTDGIVFAGFQRMKEFPAIPQMLLSFTDRINATFSDIVSLSCRQSLAIGYPDNGTGTYYSSIYIMGTSDPDLALTMNGTTVERDGTKGCFGVEVRLALGSNHFTFRQGGNAVTVTVKRLSSQGSGTISVVTKASRFPVSNAAVLAGDTLTFRCVAPSGGAVTATIHGQTVTMTQKVATAQKGIAATFEGTYQVPKNLDADSLTDLGQVTYTLTYGGATSTYQSEGTLYGAGENVTPMVLASTEVVSILSDYTDDSTILETLHYGARIATTGCVQYNGSIFYKVQGGYISDSRSELVTEVVPASGAVTDVSSVTEERDTTVTLTCGNYPAVTGSVSGGVLRLFFRDTTLPEDLSGLQCDLVTLAKGYATLGGTQLMLTLTDESELWGYDIQYDDSGNVILTLKKAPTLSTVPGKPLTGISVMVDAGHGNYDCGALGVAGGDGGPTESELNLAIGLALQQRLEQLGATVVVTRVTDDTTEDKIVLDERVSMAVDAKPDFFLSIHHNSTALVKNVTADWMEVYYYEEMSRPFAENLRLNMMEATGRDCREPEWGYYYVTRLAFCPAVLFEVGYIPNPTQYEDCTNWLKVYNTACAMAEAIVESVPAQQATPEA